MYCETISKVNVHLT